MRYRRLRPGSLALTGLAGVILAHMVSYLAAFPDGGERAAYLHETGHGYWPLAVSAAVAAGGAVLVAALWHGWRRVRRPHTGSEGAAYGIRLAALTTWQVVLFGGMESLERGAVGVSPGSLLHSPEFVIGLALQVVVAWALLRLTRSVESLASRVVAALGRRRREASASLRRPLGRLGLPRPLHRSPIRSRAPPAALAR